MRPLAILPPARATPVSPGRRSSGSQKVVVDELPLPNVILDRQDLGLLAPQVSLCLLMDRCGAHECGARPGTPIPARSGAVHRSRQSGYAHGLEQSR
jgi:hypothetical protein